MTMNREVIIIIIIIIIIIVPIQIMVSTKSTTAPFDAYDAYCLPLQ